MSEEETDPVREARARATDAAFEEALEAISLIERRLVMKTGEAISATILRIMLKLACMRVVDDNIARRLGVETLRICEEHLAARIARMLIVETRPSPPGQES